MVTTHYRQGFKVLEVDTKKAEYQGIPWNRLGDWGKRKYENYLIIKSTMEEKKPVKVIYT